MVTNDSTTIDRYLFTAVLLGIPASVWLGTEALIARMRLTSATPTLVSTVVNVSTDSITIRVTVPADILVSVDFMPFLAHISWSKCCLYVCLDVNQGGTNRNRCTQKLVTLRAQTY